MTDASSTMVRRLGISGTDTGVGKTVVSCALAALARQRGVRVGAMKPLESGIEERPVSATGLASDADRLRHACGNLDALEHVRPYVLREPLAPMVAAQRAGVQVSPLIEGAGGLLVPITPAMSYLDLFVRWECELVLVAANRLGVLNHVLLTLRAASAAGLPVAAIVLTSMNARDATLAEATNYDALRQLVPQTRLLRFPWVDRTDDLEALAVAAEAAGLDALLGT
jgi:dethiobiotin synthetase